MSHVDLTKKHKKDSTSTDLHTSSRSGGEKAGSQLPTQISYKEKLSIASETHVILLVQNPSLTSGMNTACVMRNLNALLLLKCCPFQSPVSPPFQTLRRGE